MAKARELLGSFFTFYKGVKLLPIVKMVIRGEINPRATYIQRFEKLGFQPNNPDVVFITTGEQMCYLYKVD